MKLKNKHIILLGFKNVGKTVIGQELVTKLHRDFIDMDQQIEIFYQEKFQKKISYRQIMQYHDQEFFRNLESQVLKKIISSKPAVISLGGGTPLTAENQSLIKPHLVVYITAPRNIVFERIMINGSPAFFNSQEDPLVDFNRLWDEREKVYQKLALFAVSNNGLIKTVVDEVFEKLNN